MQPEVAIRLPSVLLIVASIAAVAIGFYRTGRTVEAVALCCGWIALDWVQLFYTTEARPYAAVQCLTLVSGMLAWRLVQGGDCARWFTPPGSSPSLLETTGTQASATVANYAWWFAASMAAVACHPTAVFAVAVQVLVIFLFAIVGCRFKPAAIVVVLGAILAVFALVLVNISPAWSAREQWNAFAGDASYRSVKGLFPQIHVLGMILCAGCVVGVGRFVWRRHDLWAQSADDQCVGSFQARPAREIGYWLLLAIVPIGLAWWLTYSGIAPLMHRRYVIGSLFPALMLAASCLDLVGSRLFRVVLVIGTIAALLVVQGSPAQWRLGRWSPWQRLEGWRQASRFIDEHSDADGELWCSSSLIEGNQQPPLSPGLESYLDYPLSGLYQPESIASANIRPLVNDPRFWWEQVADSSSGQPRHVWIVHRGLGGFLLAAGRRIRVQAKQEGRRVTIVKEPVSFGSVSVMCLSVDQASRQK